MKEHQQLVWSKLCSARHCIYLSGIPGEWRQHSISIHPPNHKPRWNIKPWSNTFHPNWEWSNLMYSAFSVRSHLEIKDIIRKRWGNSLGVEILEGTSRSIMTTDLSTWGQLEDTDWKFNLNLGRVLLNCVKSLLNPNNWFQVVATNGFLCFLFQNCPLFLKCLFINV